LEIPLWNSANKSPVNATIPALIKTANMPFAPLGLTLQFENDGWGLLL